MTPRGVEAFLRQRDALKAHKSPRMVSSVLGAVRNAVDAQGSTYHYCMLPDDTVRIVACEPAASELAIPELLDGFLVTELGDASCARMNGVQEVLCPRTLRAVGAHAFSGCMGLSHIELNEGLVSIGDEAFTLAAALGCVELPRSVRHLGVNLAGEQVGRFAVANTQVAIACDSPYLFVDDEGVVYEREGTGFKLVDASALKKEAYVVDPRCTSIGHRAFASKRHLVCVELPHGLTRIGFEAFRGCTSLVRLDFPQTLVSLGRGALSCTALRRLVIPAGLVDLTARSLCTGPVNEGQSCMPYNSQLESISVDPQNPMFEMVGSVLCVRLDGGTLEAVLACGRAEEIVFDRRVVRVNDQALAGVRKVGHLRIHESIIIENELGLLPESACDALTVDFDSPRDGRDRLELDLCGVRATTALAGTVVDGKIDVDRVVSNYDVAVAKLEDRLAQARGILSRLADPFLLCEETRARFADVVTSALESVCVRFGERGYLRGFDQMIEAGILTERNISHVIGVLTGFSDATSVSYLLRAKRERFGEVAWDYAL